MQNYITPTELAGILNISETSLRQKRLLDKLEGVNKRLPPCVEGVKVDGTRSPYCYNLDLVKNWLDQKEN
jgi:hypothetical protein